MTALPSKSEMSVESQPARGKHTVSSFVCSLLEVYVLICVEMALFLKRLPRRRRPSPRRNSMSRKCRCKIAIRSGQKWRFR